jgi:hypothetical protein
VGYISKPVILELGGVTLRVTAKRFGCGECDEAAQRPLR